MFKFVDFKKTISVGVDALIDPFGMYAGDS